MKNSIIMLCVIVIHFVVLPMFAPVHSAELPDGINDFVHSYLAAAKQNDTESMIKLSHQASIDCSVKNGEQKFYDGLLRQQMKIFSKEDPIMKIKYQPLSDEDLKKMTARLKERNTRWPVNPEGRILIMYSSFHKISKLAIFVARDAQGWKWVHVCKEEGQEETQSVVFNE